MYFSSGPTLGLDAARIRETADFNGNRKEKQVTLKTLNENRVNVSMPQLNLNDLLNTGLEADAKDRHGHYKRH